MTYNSIQESSRGGIVAGVVGTIVVGAALAYVAVYSGNLPDALPIEKPSGVRPIDEASRLTLREASDRLAAERSVILHRQ